MFRWHFRAIPTGALASPAVLGRLEEALPKEPNLRSGDLLMDNLADIANVKLAIPKPNIYYSTPRESIPDPIREQLSSYIEPSTHEDRTAAPNLFIVFEGSSGGSGNEHDSMESLGRAQYTN
jgi:hypothetical protein